MKVTFKGRLMTVRLRAESYRAASEELVSYAELPPEGYRLVGANIHTRSKSGRAVNYNLLLLLVSKTVEAFDEQEAREFFA